jgi:membrane-associated phospholipid phosphatase
MKMKGILLITMLMAFHAEAQQDSASSKDDDEQASPFAVQTLKPIDHIYHSNKAIDYPVTLVLGGTSIYLLTVVYSKKPTPVDQILKLNKNDLPAYDRWTAGWHDDNLDKASYIPFYAVMPLPLVLLADKRIAPDKGPLGVMYLEAFAFEGIMYTSAVYFVDRFRPDVYNTSLSLNYRTNGNFRNSFFAGHVAVVANTTFFMSSVWSSYHPESHLKWVWYTGSAAATLGMAYMRLYAGKHFTSDIVVGTAVGVACGLLTPAIHKNRDIKKSRWSLLPSLMDDGKGGFTFTYHL